MSPNGLKIYYAELNGQMNPFMVNPGTTVSTFLDILENNLDVGRDGKKVYVNDQIASDEDVLEAEDVVTLQDKIAAG